MAFRSQELTPREAEVVNNALKALKHGRDATEKVKAAVGIHLARDGSDNGYEFAYLRFSRLNMAPTIMEQVGSRYRLVPGVREVFSEMEPDLRKARMALVMGNTERLNQLMDKALDAFERNSGYTYTSEPYSSLEAQLGNRMPEGFIAIDGKSTMHCMAMSRSAIKASAVAMGDNIHAALSVGIDLDLSHRAQDDLLRVLTCFIDPVDHILKGLSAMKIATEVALPMLSTPEELRENDIPGQVHEVICKALGMALMERFSDTGLGEKPNIKAIVIYPLLVTPLSRLKRKAPEFCTKLIRVIEEGEQDKDLRAAIKAIDASTPR